MKKLHKETKKLSVSETRAYLRTFFTERLENSPKLLPFLTDLNPRKNDAVPVSREALKLSTRAADVTIANAPGFTGQPNNVRVDGVRFYFNQIFHNLIGCTIDENNVQDHTFPGVHTQGVAAFVTESSEFAGTVPSFNKSVEVTAHSIAYSFEVSHKFMNSMTGTKDELLLEYVKNGRDALIDSSILYADGTDGAPDTGIYYHTHITPADGSSLSKAKLDAIEESVSLADAPMDGRFYLINPSDAKKLKSRPVVSGSDKMLLQKGLLNDTPYIETPKVTAGHIFYGHFSGVLISFFGNPEFHLKRLARSGNIVISLYDEIDINLLRPDWVKVLEDVD